ncbi:transposase [Lactobacillus acetotolerans]|nr:helix-turn-helix domain-containing protein [Lactobacillus acetotolerans]BAQ57084.1 transposase [Lactobacillus acetotolerans]
MTKYQANTKLRAIKLYQKGVDLNQISKELNITNANEIDHWLKRYQQQGLSGLKAKQT